MLVNLITDFVYINFWLVFVSGAMNTAIKKRKFFLSNFINEFGFFICMQIYFEKNNKIENVKINKPMMLKEVLKSFDVVNESVILVRNGDICLEDSAVEDSDKIKVLSVVSGG
jgi:sulfur carrier protein ThiS